MENSTPHRPWLNDPATTAFLDQHRGSPPDSLRPRAIDPAIDFALTAKLSELVNRKGCRPRLTAAVKKKLGNREWSPLPFKLGQTCEPEDSSVIVALLHDALCTASPPVFARPDQKFKLDKEDDDAWPPLAAIRWEVLTTRHVPALTAADLPRLQDCIDAVERALSESKGTATRGPSQETTDQRIRDWLKLNVTDGGRDPATVTVTVLKKAGCGSRGAIGRSQAWKAFHKTRTHGKPTKLRRSIYLPVGRPESEKRGDTVMARIDFDQMESPADMPEAITAGADQEETDRQEAARKRELAKLTEEQRREMDQQYRVLDELGQWTGEYGEKDWQRS
jgi:hypothetical protein